MIIIKLAPGTIIRRLDQPVTPKPGTIIRRLNQPLVMEALRRQREQCPTEEHSKRNQSKQAAVSQLWRRPILGANLPNSQGEEHQHHIEQQSTRIGPPPDASVRRPEQLEHGRGLVPDFRISGCRFTKDVVASRRKRDRGSGDALVPDRWLPSCWLPGRWLTAPGHSDC